MTDHGLDLTRLEPVPPRRSDESDTGVDLDRIRKDSILHEALTTGADPLHLGLVFNLSHTTASR